MFRLATIAALAALLAACAGPQPEAHVPSSGISGPNGGATETIYYDAKGDPHFQG